jgi:hypothetical protein
VLNEAVTTDVARVLAELVDTALADNWDEDVPAMALLWEASDDPDNPRIAVKPLEDSIENELAPLADIGPYLAVAHSAVSRQPPAQLLGHCHGAPVRITVAVDHRSETGVVRHRSGATEWFGALDLPVVKLIRSVLCLEPGSSG